MPALNVLILKADVFAAESLRRQILAVYPDASCTVANRIASAREALAKAPVDLFVSGTRAPDGDLLDLLSSTPAPARRVLVVTSHREPRLLASLRALRVAGVFDPSTDTPGNLSLALTTSGPAASYWSASVQQAFERRTSDRYRLRQLTLSEQLVLGAIGDGSDNDAASALLGMKPSTIQAVRQSLHAWLQVHDNWKLICTAVDYGFARFTERGVMRFGFGMLLMAYQTQTQRPVPMTAALAAAYPEVAASARRRHQARKCAHLPVGGGFSLREECSSGGALSQAPEFDGEHGRTSNLGISGGCETAAPREPDSTDDREESGSVRSTHFVVRVSSHCAGAERLR